MSEREPKRKSGIGRGVLAALCAVSLALTALSGCRVYVMGSTAPNHFLGEWHADYTWDGISYSTEYEFDDKRRYTYINIRQSTSDMVGDEETVQGSYEYDDENLFLKPDASDVAPSEIEYDSISDSMLRFKERITTSRTRTVTYHRHP